MILKYTALIFDIVNSRQYQNRLNVQSILMKGIEYLNCTFRDSIKKDVIPSAGDEFQGLFIDLRTAFLYVRKLQLLIYPVKIRAAIGYGTIKYDVEEWSSSAFDGEAYYLARDGINSIPKNKSNVICFNTNSKVDKYINMYSLANSEIKSKQSKMARWIELIADILLPLSQINEIESYYTEIIQIRSCIQDCEFKKITSSRKSEIGFSNTNIHLLFELKNNYSNKKTHNDSLYIEEFWEHGMMTDIAEIINTSRQNVNRYVYLGKIKESRTMDKSIYELLGEIC